LGEEHDDDGDGDDAMTMTMMKKKKQRGWGNKLRSGGGEVVEQLRLLRVGLWCRAGDGARSCGRASSSTV
jgi:hypothetical protein